MRLLLISLFVLCACFSRAQCKVQTIAELPKELNETSALVYFDNFFWTINDSGNSNHIYVFDTLGNIINKIEILGVKNTDWEALTIDDENIYIGDFGNNFNSRKNLVIYAVKRLELNQKQVEPHIIISFEYPDQVSKKKSIRKTKFDCEAMVVIHGKIWLFTKDWDTFSGAIYSLNIESGKQVANKVANLNANGLITDATLYQKHIYMIGYQDYVPILWTYNLDRMKYEKRYELPQIKKYQTEGIAIVKSKIYFTCEKSKVKQSLFSISCP